MIEQNITVYDLKRLDSYSKNLCDFHLIMDLVPTLAKLFFLILPENCFSLSYVQAAILVGLGLQFKTIDTLQGDLKLQANQLLPLFNKSIRKFTKLFNEIFEREIEAEMNQEDQIRNEKLEEVKQNKFAAEGIKESMEEELGEGAGTDLQKKLS